MNPERGAPSAHMTAAVPSKGTGKSRMQTRGRGAAQSGRGSQGAKGRKGDRAGKGRKGGKGRPQTSNLTSMPLDAAPLTATSHPPSTIPAETHGAGVPDTTSPVGFLIRGAQREELDGVLNSIFSMSPTLTRFANEVARVTPEGNLSTHGIATMLAHPRFGSTEVLLPVMQELLDHARIVFTSLPRTVSLHTPHGPVRISFARDAARALEEGGHLQPRDVPAGHGPSWPEAVPVLSADQASAVAPPNPSSADDGATARAAVPVPSADEESAAAPHSPRPANAAPPVPSADGESAVAHSPCPAGNGTTAQEAPPVPPTDGESAASPRSSRQISVHHNGVAKVVAAAGCSSTVGSCTICRSELALGQDAATTLCMHTFHSTCLERWLQREQQVALEETLSQCRCPQCNTNLLAIASPPEYNRL